MKHYTAFHVHSEGQRIRIPIEELQFVEVRADACVLHLNHAHITTEDSPEKIWSCLPERNFVAIRRKFMINLHHIAGVCDDYIHMKTGLIAQRERQTGMIAAYWLNNKQA